MIGVTLIHAGAACTLSFDLYGSPPAGVRDSSSSGCKPRNRPRQRRRGLRTKAGVARVRTARRHRSTAAAGHSPAPTTRTSFVPAAHTSAKVSASSRSANGPVHRGEGEPNSSISSSSAASASRVSLPRTALWIRLAASASRYVGPGTNGSFWLSASAGALRRRQASWMVSTAVSRVYSSCRSAYSRSASAIAASPKSRTHLGRNRREVSTRLWHSGRCGHEGGPRHSLRLSYSLRAESQLPIELALDGARAAPAGGLIAGIGRRR